jgi:hypothetical protein
LEKYPEMKTENEKKRLGVMRSTTKKKGIEMFSSLSHTFSSHDIPKTLEHRNWGPKLS